MVSLNDFLRNSQPTRELDVWLAKNIAGQTIKEVNGQYVVDDLNNPTPPVKDRIHHYTTGDLIDPIRNLARNYFQDYQGFYQNWSIHYSDNGVFVECHDEDLHSDCYNDETLAIADVLFQAHSNLEAK